MTKVAALLPPTKPMYVSPARFMKRLLVVVPATSMKKVTELLGVGVPVVEPTASVVVSDVVV